MTIFTSPHLLDSTRWNNMRIGLLGGSFNPPHKGHVHISMAAMRGLNLDAIWWLVTPKNPIKCKAPLPLDERMRLSQEINTHPEIIISGLESDLGTSITYDTIRKIKIRFPKTDFVWISGMDTALNLHHWHHWRDLLGEICMVHLTRNPARSLVRNSPLRMYRRQKHIFIDRAGCMPLDSGTTYWMMQKKMINISSTQIREKLL